MGIVDKVSILLLKEKYNSTKLSAVISDRKKLLWLYFEHNFLDT
jgi:hypothetical protein